jgi:hypothetical protein
MSPTRIARTGRVEGADVMPLCGRRSVARDVVAERSGYGPGMSSITIPEIATRISGDGAGYSHDVVAVTSAVPALALRELKAAARALATELAEALDDSVAGRAGDSGWGLELVDVRLVPGPAENGAEGWCAYGLNGQLGQLSRGQRDKGYGRDVTCACYRGTLPACHAFDVCPGRSSEDCLTSGE